jgi:structural maintenance of chromosome 4
VETKYQTAVLAIGGSEYLLVQTTHDAENVVSFVRQKKLGRITCIVMSHIQKTLKKEFETITRHTRLPPQADLLLNHIKCNNPEHQVLFFFFFKVSFFIFM